VRLLYDLVRVRGSGNNFLFMMDERMSSALGIVAIGCA
jgi:hypothetical protein